MKSNRYTAMDFLVGIAYGGLTEYNETVANIVFGLAVVVALVMSMKDVKMAEIFGDGQGKFSLKSVAIRVIVVFIGLTLGHLIMKKLLTILA